MEIKIKVEINGIYGTWGASVTVPELFNRAFMPLKTCDDAMIAMATGDHLAEDIAGITVMKTREDAGDILSKELSKMLVSAMKKQDTHNGYKKEF